MSGRPTGLSSCPDGLSSPGLLVRPPPGGLSSPDLLASTASGRPKPALKSCQTASTSLKLASGSWGRTLCQGDGSGRASEASWYGPAGGIQPRRDVLRPGIKAPAGYQKLAGTAPQAGSRREGTYQAGIKAIGALFICINASARWHTKSRSRYNRNKEVTKLMAKTYFCNEKSTADTPNGKLRGYFADGVYVFHGIRYAQAKRFPRPWNPGRA